MHDSLRERPAVELRRRIGSRRLSPVELMQACIARIEAINPAVNAIAATDFERALEAARAAEAQLMRGEPEDFGGSGVIRCPGESGLGGHIGKREGFEAGAGGFVDWLSIIIASEKALAAFFEHGFEEIDLG